MRKALPIDLKPAGILSVLGNGKKLLVENLPSKIPNLNYLTSKFNNYDNYITGTCSKYSGNMFDICSPSTILVQSDQNN